MKGAINRVVVEEPGEWISDKGKWRCSCCGERIALDVFRWGKFCPCCGRPMIIKYKGVNLK